MFYPLTGFVLVNASMFFVVFFTQHMEVIKQGEKRSSEVWKSEIGTELETKEEEIKKGWSKDSKKVQR